MATARHAEVPVLRMGLAGFSPDEEALVCAQLAERATERQMVWQVGALGDADAWCVNGSRLRRLPDGTWRIVPAQAMHRPLHINPEQLEWPVAFSMPAGPPDFQPTHQFELEAPHSLQQTLDHLEGWLRPLLVQFQLVSQIMQQKLDLGSGVYHVSVQAKLYAVVSRRTGIGVWPIADPEHLEHAVWSRRPESADVIPASFVRTSLPEAMWQYATRTRRDCLPPQYRRKCLFLRRPPQLPARLLGDACLLLVRELARGPATLAELAQRTGLPGPELARQLGALFMVGSITANPARMPACAPAPAPADAPSEPGWNSSLVVSCGPGDSSVPSCDVTVRLKAGRGVAALD